MMKELKNVPVTRRLPNSALTPRAQTVLGYLVFGIDEPDRDHPAFRPASRSACIRWLKSSACGEPSLTRSAARFFSLEASFQNWLLFLKL